MSAGDIAAIIAVFELPPRFSRKSHVNTESRYGMKSAFFDFFDFDACVCVFVGGCRKGKFIFST